MPSPSREAWIPRTLARASHQTTDFDMLESVAENEMRRAVSALPKSVASRQQRRCEIGSNPLEPPNATASGVGPKFVTNGRAIVVALVQQAFILMLAALVLDGGRLLSAVSGVLILSWLVSLIVMIRYKEHPTPVSIAIVKYGFWLAILVLLLVGPWVGVPVFGV